MRCQLADQSQDLAGFDQLFVNGRRQIRARFPNLDDSDPKSFTGYMLAAGQIAGDVRDPLPGANDDMDFSGGAPRGIAFQPDTFTAKRWGRPQEAVIHIFQAHGWGNLQWHVKHIDWEHHASGLARAGTRWARNGTRRRPRSNERSHFFVENVFEELDAPGEWYLDRATRTLYFSAAARRRARQQPWSKSPLLQQLVRFIGTADDPCMASRWLAFASRTPRRRFWSRIRSRH